MQNFQSKTDEIIADCISNNRRPTLLLHSCCAPCSSYVMEYLRAYFDITVYYYNPNIAPIEEYLRRLAESKQLIDTFNQLDSNTPIKFLNSEYAPDVFLALTKGLEAEKEGGSRCHKCYELRLDATAKLAKQLGYEYFATTLTVSPYKNATYINELGAVISEKYDISYLTSDFKKRNGYLRSIELSKQYGLYRQDYCGCTYSATARRTTDTNLDKNI